MSAARVVASHMIDAHTTSIMSGEEHTSPAAAIEVNFDYGTAEDALRVLDACVAEVRAQIEETRR